MLNTKIGIFSILMFGVMMLLIPATSIVNAQEYDKYYQETERDRYNDHSYEHKDNRQYENMRYDYRNEYDHPSNDKKNQELKFADIIEFFNNIDGI
ncbi:MAG: hypothetical protein R3321_09475, partial [Nitrososphaeraceae archaeon]|nr:hypothetical protein [Nitrososphaeraceae archaeon]